MTLWLIGYGFTMGYGGMFSAIKMRFWTWMFLAFVTAVFWPVLLGMTLGGHTYTGEE